MARIPRHLTQGQAREWLRVGTRKAPTIEQPSVRNVFRTDPQGDDYRTRHYADRDAVAAYVNVMRWNDVRFADVQRDLLDPENELGRYIRDCPNELVRMWWAGIPASPWHETAARRMVNALAVACEEDPPRWLNQSDLRRATASPEDDRSEPRLALRSVCRAAYLGMEQVPHLVATNRPEKRNTGVFYMLVGDPDETIEALRHYRYSQTETAKKDTGRRVAVLGVRDSPPPQKRADREAVYQVWWKQEQAAREAEHVSVVSDWIRNSPEFHEPSYSVLAHQHLADRARRPDPELRELLNWLDEWAPTDERW